MITFKLKYDAIVKEYPEVVNQLITELRNSNSPSKDIAEEKTDWVITWGFFVKKAKTEEEKLEREEKFMEKFKLGWEDRLKLELPKIRVTILMKAGNYVRGDRFETVSSFVTEMATQIMNFTMHKEQEHFQYQDVIDTLPSLPVQEETNVTEELNIDVILDKISEQGMSSLSQSELEFLEHSSRSSN